MLNKLAKKFITALILAIVVLSLSGCRESMVIQEIIYDQASEDIDFQNDLKIAKSDENSQNEDENMPTKKNKENKEKNKEEHQASKKGDKDNNGSASNTTYNKNSKNNDKNNTNGTKTGNNGESSTPSDDNTTAGPSDNPNDRQIYDGNGNIVDLPEEVNSVVVTGSAASIVQMLGGKSIISGSSSSFTSNALARQVFEAEDIGNTKTLWDGDGSSVMSSSNFENLLKMKPDVCVTISGQNSFSSSQLSTLKSKNIAVVTLPALTSSDNIQTAVNVVGDMIGDRSGEEGGVNAKELATDYEKYCNNLISEVKQKTGLFTWNNIDFNTGEKTANNTASDGQYTLYISQWSESAYKITNSSGTTLFKDNTGVAVAPKGYSDSPLSYYLSVAGVCNNGARFVRNQKSQYAVSPFNRNVFKHSTGEFEFYGDSNESFVRAWNGGSIDVGLGESKFKSIIVDSQTIKNKIQSSDSWKYYGKATVNNVTDYGFVADDGSMVTSYIRGDYNIYVNPYGVESWTDGSVESVLETIWTAWKFHGAYTESDVKNELKEFYSKFYRYDLSDSQAESILAGK